MAKKRDTGKNFENEIRRSLQSAKHIWWFRIQDTNDINRFVKCYAISAQQAKDLYSNKDNIKSVKWSWFDENAYIVERLKAPLRWNLQKLYEQVI